MDQKHADGHLTSPRRAAALLAAHGLRAKKRYGQNFLVDQDILEQIVAAAGVAANDVVLEVGPGLGALTEALAVVARTVVAVELDRALIAVLEETAGARPNVSIVEGDILKVDIPAILPPGTVTFKLVANLPYYITTPVIARFLESDLPWDRLVVMVQAEVAERMVASPGGKEYGPLSVLVQFAAEASIAVRVPRTAFLPAPAVDSAVVVMRRRSAPPVPVTDRAFYFRVVHGAFGQRRKTLANALAGAGFTKEAIASATSATGIDSRRRGETLSLAEFAALAAALQASGEA